MSNAGAKIKQPADISDSEENILKKSVPKWVDLLDKGAQSGGQMQFLRAVANDLNAFRHGDVGWTVTNVKKVMKNRSRNFVPRQKKAPPAPIVRKVNAFTAFAQQFESLQAKYFKDIVASVPVRDSVASSSAQNTRKANAAMQLRQKCWAMCKPPSEVHCLI